MRTTSRNDLSCTSTGKRRSIRHRRPMYNGGGMTMMVGCFLLSSLLLCSSTVEGVLAHHVDPPEDNVFSREICFLNEFGFVGTETGTPVPIKYDYELEIDGEPQSEEEIREIVNAVEKTIANEMLTLGIFEDVDCSSGSLRRRRTTSGTTTFQSSNTISTRRKLSATGIDIKPEDVVTDMDCTLEHELTNTCKVVIGEFSVWGLDAAAASDIETKLENDMKRGKFDDAHARLVKVSYIDDLTIDGVTGGEGEEDSSEIPSSQPAVSSSTAVIVGSSVGAVLILGALALYQRRRLRPMDDETLTQGGYSHAPSRSNVVEVL